MGGVPGGAAFFDGAPAGEGDRAEPAVQKKAATVALEVDDARVAERGVVLHVEVVAAGEVRGAGDAERARVEEAAAADSEDRAGRKGGRAGAGGGAAVPVERGGDGERL